MERRVGPRMGSGWPSNSNREGGYDVWVMPTTGGTAYQITDFGDAYVPRWSPDGQQISFHRTPSFGGSDIWITDASNVEGFFTEMTHQRIAGVVTSPLDGSPWSGVRIRIQSEDGGATYRIASGADGRYKSGSSREPSWLTSNRPMEQRQSRFR